MLEKVVLETHHLTIQWMSTLDVFQLSKAALGWVGNGLAKDRWLRLMCQFAATERFWILHICKQDLLIPLAYKLNEPLRK